MKTSKKSRNPGNRDIKTSEKSRESLTPGDRDMKTSKNPEKSRESQNPGNRNLDFKIPKNLDKIPGF